MQVQTVLGPISPEALGRTLPHEHIFVALRGRNGAADMLQVTDEAILAEELEAFRAGGGTTIVDQTPRGAGRDPGRLVAISRHTGLQVVAATGWYTQDYYPPEDEIERRSISELAEILLAEATDGIDGSGVRPGLLGELGSTSSGTTAAEERVLRAAAKVQALTGLPIATHALTHAVGREQLRILEDAGADPARVCIGHCDAQPDLDYCLEIIGRGAFVGIDNIGQTDPNLERDVIRLVVQLVEAGHQAHVLLSQDVGQASELARNGGRGYAYLMTRFLPRLRAAGLSAQVIDVLTIDNPRQFLTT